MSKDRKRLVGFTVITVSNAITTSFLLSTFVILPGMSVLIQVIVYNIFIVIPMYRSSLKFWTLFVTIISYLGFFIKDFYKPYVYLLKECLNISDQYATGTKAVSVKTFSNLVEILIPLKTQVTFLIGKLLILISAVIIIFHVMENGIESFIPVVLLLASPAIARSFITTNIEDYISFHSGTISEYIKNDKLTLNSKSLSENMTKHDTFSARTCAYHSFIVFIFTLMPIVCILYVIHLCLASCKCKFD